MSLTNAKSAFCVTGAELKSGFQTTFEENNGHVYFTNVCSLGGENVSACPFKGALHLVLPLLVEDDAG